MPTQRQQILFICAKCKTSNMKLMSYAERKGNHQADLFCEACEVVKEEEIDGIPMSKYIRSLNEEFCVYCDKKENLHNVNGSSVGDYYSCGCDE